MLKSPFAVNRNCFNIPDISSSCHWWFYIILYPLKIHPHDFPDSFGQKPLCNPWPITFPVESSIKSSKSHVDFHHGKSRLINHNQPQESSGYLNSNQPMDFFVQEASGALELSESAFQHFFSTALTRALARLEAGKLWRPKRRGSRR